MGSMDASGRALRGASRTGLLRARISSWTRLEARYGLPGSIRTGRRDRASGVAGGCGEESKMLIVAHRGNAPRIRSLVARGNRHIDFGNYARNLTDTTSALLFNYPYTHPTPSRTERPQCDPAESPPAARRAPGQGRDFPGGRRPVLRSVVLSSPRVSHTCSCEQTPCPAVPPSLRSDTWDRDWEPAIADHRHPPAGAGWRQRAQ